jgi:hypothetical protein
MSEKGSFWSTPPGGVHPPAGVTDPILQPSSLPRSRRCRLSQEAGSRSTPTPGTTSFRNWVPSPVTRAPGLHGVFPLLLGGAEVIPDAARVNGALSTLSWRGPTGSSGEAEIAALIEAGPRACRARVLRAFGRGRHSVSAKRRGEVR